VEPSPSRWGALLAGVALVALVVLGGQPHGAGAQDAPVPTDPAPSSVAPPPEVPASAPTQSGSAPLVPVPVGCVAPPAAQVVFLGELVAADFRTGRFDIDAVSAGSADPWRGGNLIDVHYGDDVRYLQVGERYIVGARVDDDTGLLSSKIREPAPLFGGNEVVGVNDTDLDCPVFEDPMRTLRSDGTSVDSGLLTPLTKDSGRLVRAFVVPALVAFAIVFALALVRWGFTGLAASIVALFRAATTPAEERHAHRRRVHHGVEPGRATDEARVDALSR
jgi:hypothetical protein